MGTPSVEILSGPRSRCEVLAVYDAEQVLARTEPKSRLIARAFEAMRELAGVTETRSIGMIGALDLGATRGYHELAGWRVFEEALKRGAYLRPLGNVVYVTPALNIEDKELAELLEIVAESIRAAHSG